MKKFLLITLFTFVLLISPSKINADENNFAFTVISPDKTISKCLFVSQNNLLQNLKENDFQPIQDDTGFIYSLIGYSGPQSSDPGSQNSFWSLWTYQNNYQFSNLGPSAITPEKKQSYVFYFGDGRKQPPTVNYNDVCKTPTQFKSTSPTPTRPSVTQQTPQSPSTQNSDFNIDPSVNYLKSNFQNQVLADQDWAAIALGSFNIPSSVLPTDNTNISSLSRNTLALSAQGIDNSINVNKIKQSFQNNQFGDPGLMNDDLFAILAIASQDFIWLSSHQEVFDTVLNSQRNDGSFGFTQTGSGDVDMTSAAIWALSLKPDYPQMAINKALNYLNDAQNSDGGYGYIKGQPSNIASTAWAATAYTTAKHSNSRVFAYIESQRRPDGSWLFAGQPSYRTTAYAVMALSKKTLPITKALIQPKTTPKQVSPVSPPKKLSPIIQQPKTQNTIIPRHSSLRTSSASSSAASSTSTASSASSSASSSSSSINWSCSSSASSISNASSSGGQASASSSASSSSICN